MSMFSNNDMPSAAGRGADSSSSSAALGSAAHEEAAASPPSTQAVEQVLQQQLRDELAAKDEAVFDLQMSLQAVEAEKVHEIQSLQKEHAHQLQLLEEQLRRAVQEANLARRSRNAGFGLQPQQPHQHVSGHFPPPLAASSVALSAKAGIAASTTMTAAAAAAIMPMGREEGLAAANSSNNVVTPGHPLLLMPVAGASDAIAAAAATAINAKNLPSSQNQRISDADGGGGGVPREIQCEANKFFGEGTRRPNSIGGTVRANGGPRLAGTLLELVVAALNSSAAAAAAAASQQSERSRGQDPGLSGAPAAAPRSARSNASAEPVNAALSLPSLPSSSSASRPHDASAVLSKQIGPNPPPSLLSTSSIVPTLIRWSQSGAEFASNSNRVTEEEVLLLCAEQAVLAAGHRARLQQKQHGVTSSRSSGPSIGPPVALPASSDPILGWSMLEWALVLASPRERQRLRHKVVAAAAAAANAAAAAPSVVAASEQRGPSEACSNINDMDVENVRPNSSRDDEARGAFNELVNTSQGRPRSHRIRKSCIRSLQDGAGMELRPSEIVRELRRTSHRTDSSESDLEMSRWEGTLLQNLLVALQSAAAEWSAPEISIPACRVMHMLLGPPSQGDQPVTTDSALTARSDDAHDHQAPTPRPGVLPLAAWLWGTLKRQRVGLLDSFEQAATRLIDIHAGISQNSEKKAKNPLLHRPRRCLTAADAPPPRADEDDEETTKSAAPSRRAADSSAVGTLTSSRSSSAAVPRGSDDTTMTAILQWMSVSLPLFASSGLIIAAEPEPTAQRKSGEAIGTTEASAPIGGDAELPPSAADGASEAAPPPPLARRLLATVLDVLELVVLPLLEEEPEPQGHNQVDSRGRNDTAVAHHAPSSFPPPSVDVVLLLRFTSVCASFLTGLARLDPTCSTVRPSSSSVSKSHLVLLRAEMPTTRSTSDQWDRAPSAIAVATGLLHAVAVQREGRDAYEAAAHTPPLVLEEENKLIYELISFFHQLLRQVQWERRWKIERRKVGGGSDDAPGAAAGMPESSSAVTSSSSTSHNSSTKKRSLVTFWQLLAPCRHRYLTASSLLRHSLRDKTTFWESDEDAAAAAVLNAASIRKAEATPESGRESHLAAMDGEVRHMLGLQLDELVDDEDELLHGR
jgi:hypothetical protein